MAGPGGWYPGGPSPFWARRDFNGRGASTAVTSNQVVTKGPQTLASVQAKVAAQPAVKVADDRKYGSINSNIINVTAVGASVLPRQNFKRIFLCIQNISAQPIAIGFGQLTVFNTMLILNAGSPGVSAGGTAFYDAFVPQDEIWLIAASGSSNQVLLQYSTADY